MVQDKEGVCLCWIVLSADDARGMEAAGGGGSTDTQRAPDKFIDKYYLKH
jgi:hypothetical protein